MAGFTPQNSIAQSTSLTNQFGASPGVNAGDLIIFFLKNNGAATAGSISDGTSSFTMTSVFDNTNGPAYCQIGYLLSSIATGNPTYTITQGSVTGM